MDFQLELFTEDQSFDKDSTLHITYENKKLDMSIEEILMHQDLIILLELLIPSLWLLLMTIYLN